MVKPTKRSFNAKNFPASEALARRPGSKQRVGSENAVPVQVQVASFLEESKTASAPFWHWQQELRKHLEDKGVIKAGKYSGKKFAGSLPNAYHAALRQAEHLLGNRGRFVQQDSATEMSVQKVGRGKNPKQAVLPVRVDDKVLRALHYNPGLPREQLAAKLGMSLNSLSNALTRLRTGGKMR